MLACGPLIGVIVVGRAAFGEDARRYYLSAVDTSGVVYVYDGRVPWPPVAGPRVAEGHRLLSDVRENKTEVYAPAAGRLNGN